VDRFRFIVASVIAGAKKSAAKEKSFQADMYLKARTSIAAVSILAAALAGRQRRAPYRKPCSRTASWWTRDREKIPRANRAQRDRKPQDRRSLRQEIVARRRAPWVASQDFRNDIS
jgi:hypothetical protein